MGTGEHLLEFGCRNPLLQIIVQPADFGQSFSVFLIRAELDENPDVLHLPGKPVPSLNKFFLNGPLPEYFLGGFTIVPKVRLGYFSLKLLDILPQTLYVKETPRVWRSARLGLLFLLILL